MKSMLTGKKYKKTEKGITLIALVVTVIVLLILAGISIMMLTGQNGILRRAEEASDKAGKANIIDQAKLDVMDRQIENYGSLSKQDLHDILVEYFTNVPSVEDEVWENYPEGFPNESGKLIAKEEYGGYEIETEDIYSGNLRGTEEIPVTPQQIADNLKEYQGTEVQRKYVDIGLDINGENDTYDDWEVFYVGNESGEYRIFLIAADYVPVSKLTAWNIIGGETTLGKLGDYGLNAVDATNQPYSVYWKSTPTWQTFPESTTNIDFVNDTFIKKVMHEKYNLTKNQSKSNSSAVSQLLNTTIWSPIKTKAKESSKIEFAIGGPTIQMWCSAWNKAVKGDTNGSVPIYENVKEEKPYGYCFGPNKIPDDAVNTYMDGTTVQTSMGDELMKNYPVFFLQNLSARMQKLLVSVSFSIRWISITIFRMPQWVRTRSTLPVI